MPKKRSNRPPSRTPSLEPPPNRLQTTGVFVDPIDHDQHLRRSIAAVSQLRFGDLSTYRENDREQFIRQALLAYHSQIVHPVALHVDEHCTYVMQRLQRMFAQVDSLASIVHANDLLREEDTSEKDPDNYVFNEDGDIEQKAKRNMERNDMDDKSYPPETA